MFWKMTPEVSTTDIDFLILQEALELPLARRRAQKIAKGRSQSPGTGLSFLSRRPGAQGPERSSCLSFLARCCLAKG